MRLAFRWGAVVAVGACLISTTVWSPSADAQEAGSAVQERYQQAFDAMLADLSDPERSFRFARIAVEAGDVRGAISALERVLLLNPNLPNIKAELGYLYLQAGSSSTAEAYLTDAQQSGAVPPEVAARIEEIRAESRRQRARNRLTGSIFLGGRFETNANAGPGGEVDLFDPNLGVVDDARLRDENAEDEDFSAIGIVDLQHRYDLGRQAGDNIETNLLFYGSQYYERDDVEIGLLDLDVGPNLNLGPADDPLRVRPFVTGSLLNLESDLDRRTAGGVCASPRCCGAAWWRKARSALPTGTISGQASAQQRRQVRAAL
jgi:tetratricopeptide (TPR) repeat protein